MINDLTSSKEPKFGKDTVFGVIQPNNAGSQEETETWESRLSFLLMCLVIASF